MKTKQLTMNVTVTAVAAAMVCTSWAVASAGTGERGQRAPLEQAGSPWGLLAMDGFEVESYTSLDSMVDSANVSVLGTVAAVRPGRTYEEREGSQTYVSQSAAMTIAVDEQLAGSAINGPLVVEFGPFPKADLEEMMADLQTLGGEPSIFVLRRKGAGAPTEGLAPSGAEFARGVYRLVSSQGLLDDADGVATAPLADLDEDQNAFLEDLVDAPFDQAVTEVDQAD